MSVTDNPNDPIPHGIEGFRRFDCRCDDGTVASCKGANRAYHRERRAAARENRPVDPTAWGEADQLAAKREQRKAKGPAIATKGIRAAAAKRSESNDSVSVAKRRGTPGDMESAVIAECADIADAKPTLLVAAKNLGRTVDELAGNPKVVALYNSTLKQLMATMAELRGDETDKRKTGKRKSGGRLATVGNLTKVKRQGA